MKKSCLSGVFCLVLFCLGLAESSGVTADIVQNPDNGHFYELVLAPGISWDQANEEANTRPGNWHLATITDSAENAFIKSLLAPGEPFFTADSDCGFAGGFIGRICGGIWLGATRASGTSNSWTWVTGEIWSFTDWGPLEPIDSTLLSLDEFRDIGPILAWNDKSPQSAPATGYIVETDVAAFISIIEAESMALSGGYAVEANAAASGGQLIRRLASGGYAATASTEYTGAAGNYDIAVSYFDENDGMSNLAFLLNGQMLDEWVADEDPVCSDCASPGANTLRTRVVARGMRLLPGDEITLQGTGEHYEYARFDKLTVSPTGSSTYEAERMALKGGYAVEDNAAASGGQLIRRLASGGYAATASTEYTAAAGTYEVTVSYFDESDGVSSLAFLVNGEILDQWLAEEDPVCSDCDSPGASTLRTRVVASELGLQPGDEITLQGTGEHYEYARFDKLTVAPTVVGPVLFNDGGDHLIDFDISTGVRVENATSVTIAPGVIISSATLYGSKLTNNGGELSSVSLHEGSLMTVNGGTIGGVGAYTGSGVILNDGVIGGADLAWDPCGGFKMFAGSIGSLSVMGPCTVVTIEGGSVGALFTYDADIVISGGEFGQFEVCCDTGFNIRGGHFTERLLVSYNSFGSISGGTFASTIDFVGDSNNAFLGELTLGEIVQNEAEYPFVFSRQVGGTFVDGTPADLRFRCRDMYTCEHVYVEQTTN